MAYDPEYFLSVHKYSVVIPHYNSSSTLERSLQSVLEQTLPADEIIIVDDHSEPFHVNALLAIYKKYTPKIKIQIELSPINKGPSYTRNRGIYLSNNTLLAFLDSDDTWNPQKNELQVMALINTSAELVSSCSINTSSRQPVEFKNIDLSLDKLSKTYIASLCFTGKFSTSSFLARKSDDLVFDESIKYCEDKDLCMSLILKKRKIFHINMPLTYKHKHHYGASGLSSDLWKMYIGDINVIYRARKNYPFISMLGLVYATCKFAFRLVYVLVVVRK